MADALTEQGIGPSDIGADPAGTAAAAVAAHVALANPHPVYRLRRSASVSAPNTTALSNVGAGPDLVPWADPAESEDLGSLTKAGATYTAVLAGWYHVSAMVSLDQTGVLADTTAVVRLLVNGNPVTLAYCTSPALGLGETAATISTLVELAAAQTLAVQVQRTAGTGELEILEDSRFSAMYLGATP